VLDVRELLSHLCHDFNKARIAFSKCLKLGQQYNIHGLAADALFDYKHAKIISKALPKLSWLQFLPPNTFSQRVVGEVPLVNSITHLDSAMSTQTFPCIMQYALNVICSCKRHAIRGDPNLFSELASPQF
jgi:hypothetical protein